MAHREQFEFVEQIKRIFPRHFRGKRVLEIGSLDIAGTIRRLFDGCDYTGIDVAPGRGVDVVCQGQDFDAPSASFDVVISCEVMEHNPYWSETFANMVRLVRPDGLVVMTCATLGRPEHGTSRSDREASPLTVAKGWEYYRNLTPADFRRGAAVEALAFHAFIQNWRAYDLYFVGSKQPLPPETRTAVAALVDAYRSRSFGSFRGLKRYVKANYLLRR